MQFSVGVPVLSQPIAVGFVMPLKAGASARAESTYNGGCYRMIDFACN